MAMPVQPLLIGVDVSKTELAVCLGPDTAVHVLANTPAEIAKWLKSLPAGPACLAVEATNTFHLCLLEQAHRAGHRPYLIDGYRLNRYREGVGGRAKNDASDARLLWRYLSGEREHLRPWSPPPQGYRTVQGLLRRRAALVQARVTLQQSLAGLGELKASCNALFRQINRLDTLIQQRLRKSLEHLGWLAEARRCQAIEGVGPITAAALIMAFQRGRFKNSDAFVAFLGLDVRVRDSGRLRGRRKLTKKGDPELRRLLFLAAMQAVRSTTWKPLYQRYLARGLAKIQALVIVARKLARVAFTLLKNQTQYLPNHRQEACAGT